MQQNSTRQPHRIPNPNSCERFPVQLTLPGIEFAPDRVREHGLVEAHTWPLVSDGKVQGVVQASFRVHASAAWSFPSLEFRSATAWPVVCLDCDGTGGYSRLMGAVQDREVLCPNWVVYRDTGGAHGVWCLARPVLRGESARARPLRLLTRATEYMAQKVEADAGYGQVLSHNPMVPVASQRLRTDWLRRRPYPLQELALLHPNAPLTQTDMNQQSAEDLAVLDGKIEVVLGELSGLLDGERGALLRAGQAAWEEFRLRQAEYEAHLYQGGTMYPLIYVGAIQSLAKERLEKLEQILKQEKEL